MASVSVATAGGIKEILLSRPLGNATTDDMGSLAVEIRSVAGDTQVQAVLLNFNAGGDLKEMQQARGLEGIAASPESFTAYTALATCSEPVVVAVHGHTLGLGLMLAGCCDIVVASEDTVFDFADFGASSDTPMTFRMLSPQLARYYMLTGDKLPASELYRSGSLARVVPRDQLDEAARGVAAKIVAAASSTARGAPRAGRSPSAALIRDTSAGGFQRQATRIDGLERGLADLRARLETLEGRYNELRLAQVQGRNARGELQRSLDDLRIEVADVQVPLDRRIHRVVERLSHDMTDVLAGHHQRNIAQMTETLNTFTDQLNTLTHRVNDFSPRMELIDRITERANDIAERLKTIVPQVESVQVGLDVERGFRESGNVRLREDVEGLRQALVALALHTYKRYQKLYWKIARTRARLPAAAAAAASAAPVSAAGSASAADDD